MKRVVTGWYQQSPDIYSGDCHSPRWIGACDGDMDGPGDCGDPDGNIVFPCHVFPAGTVITVSVPVCPECDSDAELCCCGFDWHEWAEVEFS